MLTIFIFSRQKNYAEEVLLILVQHSHQGWPNKSRFISICGVPGGNILADLRNEHLRM